MLLSPKHIYWSWIPSVMVLGPGAFGMWLGLEGAALMNWINTLIIRDHRVMNSLFSSCHERVWLEAGSLQPGRGPITEPNHAGHPDLRFPTSRTGRNTCLTVSATQSMVLCSSSTCKSWGLWKAQILDSSHD